MIKRVVCKGKLIGYNIDGNYYSLKTVSKVCNYAVHAGESISCIKVGGKYIEGDNHIIVWSCLRNSTDFKILLRSLRNNGVNVNDEKVFIERVTKNEFSDILYSNEMSSYWINNKNCYEVVSGSGYTVGLIKFKVFDSELHISMIEVLDRRKYWGTLIIKTLLEKYNLPITGYSCVEAKKFWLKINAVFTTDYDFTINI